MKHFKFLLAFTSILLWIAGTQVLAAEINSGNITWAPYNCLTTDTTCNLNGLSIDSIASGTFVNHSNLTHLYLNQNNITSIEIWDFNGLDNLQYLNLNDNIISLIESWCFDSLTSLWYLYLQENCINIEDTTITNYIDGLWVMHQYNRQYICVRINYTPSTPTSWSVLWNLYFTGPVSYVSALQTENSDLSIYDYTYLTNGVHLYDYSSMIDTNWYLLSRATWYPDTISWEVTWTTASAPAPTPTPAPVSWWGGWWAMLRKDDCPVWDFSPSYYDNICGEREVTEIDDEDAVQRYVPQSNDYTITTLASYIDDMIDTKFVVNSLEKNEVLTYRNEFIIALEQFINKTIGHAAARVKFALTL